MTMPTTTTIVAKRTTARILVLFSLTNLSNILSTKGTRRQQAANETRLVQEASFLTKCPCTVRRKSDPNPRFPMQRLWMRALGRTVPSQSPVNCVI